MIQNPNSGFFYFISDQFYIDFPDPDLKPNKAPTNGQSHGRPCFYAFKDPSTNLYWVIPISSKVAKYQAIVQKKIKRYGKCDTILFGNVLGQPRAFLIQNMFPVTEKYFDTLYINAKDNVPVRVDGAFEKNLIKSAQHVSLLVHKNIKGLIFPDVLSIEKQLLADLPAKENCNKQVSDACES